MLRGYVDEEVSITFVVMILKIAIGFHIKKTGFHQQITEIGSAEREHIQVKDRPIWKCVAKTGERRIDVLRLRHDFIAAIVVFVGAFEPDIENGVVVALVKNQDALVVQGRIELCQRPPPISSNR